MVATKPNLFSTQQDKLPVPSFVDMLQRAYWQRRVTLVLWGRQGCVVVLEISDAVIAMVERE